MQDTQGDGLNNGGEGGGKEESREWGWFDNRRESGGVLNRYVLGEFCEKSQREKGRRRSG
jgi:hypothetical protein